MSNDNLVELKRHEVQYLTRLSSKCSVYKDLVRKQVPGKKAVANAYKYGKRVLYIKKVQVIISGIDLFAYVVLEPKTRADNSTKFLIGLLDDNDTNKEELEFELLKKGVFILISSIEIDPKELLLYYERQKL